jgi:hypothetical protein
MPDLAALRAVWPEQGSLEAKLAAVNNVVVPGPVVDIAVTAVKEKLAPRMAHLECYALAAKTRDLRRRLGMSGIPQSVTSAVYLLQLLSSDERVFGKHRLGLLKSLFADLVADEASGIGQEDADGIVALSSSTVTWWSRNGFSGSGVTVYDAIEAGLS